MEGRDVVCDLMDRSGSSRGRAAGLFLALIEIEHATSPEAAIARIRAMQEHEDRRAQRLATEADDFARPLRAALSQASDAAPGEGAGLSSRTGRGA